MLRPTNIPLHAMYTPFMHSLMHTLVHTLHAQDVGVKMSRLDEGVKYVS
jgi:hypothetical protein